MEGGLAGLAGWAATGPAAHLVRPAYQRVEGVLWRARGRRGPVPHSVKEARLREAGRRLRLRVLVETGTYLGDMVWALRRDFDEIHSIELDPALHERARARFRGLPNVHLHQGDSGVELGRVVAGLRVPALFWLDGHYSGGVTARGDSDTPVLAELAHVYGGGTLPHAVLIDDAELFGQSPDYPSPAALEARLEQLRPGLRLSVADGIIAVLPGAS